MKKNEQKYEKSHEKSYEKNREKKKAPREEAKGTRKGAPKGDRKSEAKGGKKSAAKTEFVFGLHAVQALLKASPKRILELHLLTGRSDQRLQEVVAVAEQFRIGIIQASRQQLDEMAGVGEDSEDADHEGNHQGVIARCRPAEAQDETYLFKLLEGLAEKGEDPIFAGAGRCDRPAQFGRLHSHRRGRRLPRGDIAERQLGRAQPHRAQSRLRCRRSAALYWRD